MKSPPPASVASPKRLPIPPAYAPLWRHAGKSWRRDAGMLALMAETGWSCRLALSTELVRTEADLSSVRAGSIQRLWTRLQSRCLIRQRTVLLEYRRHALVSLVELTPYGRELLYQLGLPLPKVAEWQLLRQHHGADRQLKHTAMVVLAAHYFRQRGFATVCCPALPGRYAPDLALHDVATGTSLYVEVEAPCRGGRFHETRLQRKWERQTAQQGLVVLCALNPGQRERLTTTAAAVAPQGLATDLQTLQEAPELVWPAVWGVFSETPAPHNDASLSIYVGTPNIADSTLSGNGNTTPTPLPVQE